MAEKKDPERRGKTPSGPRDMEKATCTKKNNEENLSIQLIVGALCPSRRADPGEKL